MFGYGFVKGNSTPKKTFSTKDLTTGEDWQDNRITLLSPLTREA
jgi:hypothetical protein